MYRPAAFSGAMRQTNDGDELRIIPVSNPFIAL
jgi:hypothetical protein